MHGVWLTLLIAVLASSGANSEGTECIACAADLAAIRAEFDDAAWQKLLAGEVVSWEPRPDPPGGAGGPRMAAAAGVIPRTPEQVWAVLVDFAHPRDFLPNVEEIRVRRAEGNRIYLEEHLKVAFTHVRFGAIWELDPERGEVRFALDPTVPHDIEDSRGMYRVVRMTEPERTLLRYQTAVDTGRAIPAMVERLLTRRSLPGLIDALRAEVIRRHPESP